MIGVVPVLSVDGDFVSGARVKGNEGSCENFLNCICYYSLQRDLLFPTE